MKFAVRLISLMATVFALAFTAGCGDDSGLELRVRLVTSFVPGAEFEEVEVALLAPTSQLDSAEVLRTTEKTVTASDSFTRGAEVATISNVASGAALVRVRLKSPNGEMLAQRRVSFNISDNNTITVYITRDCAGVVCPGAGGASLTECFAGTCVDPKCDPNNAATREQFCGTATFCDAPSDCPFVQSCAQPWCTDGVCIPEPLTRGSDACESGEYCNPTTGCVPTEGPLPDGGVPGNCSMNNGGCMENQLCQNGPDGPICAEECVSGYVWNTTTMMCDPRCTEAGYVWSPSEMDCIDINECEDPETCDQICTNTVGSFECSCVENATLGSDGICRCDSGFREEGDVCVDVNECLGEGGAVTGCLENELCTNIPGSYHCGPCKPGYFRSGSACAPGQIEGGSHFSCTLGADGRVSCWGANSALYDDTDNDRYELGSLGTGDTLDRRLPEYVTDSDGVEIQAMQIALGAETAYALQDDGTVLAWGANFTTRRTPSGTNVVNAGQLGTGSADKNATRPVTVTGVANAIHVVAGRSHACALIDDDANRVGTIKCWGDNSFGQVGNNAVLPASGTQQRTPVDVVGIDDAVWITAGAYHTCALRASNNKVVCWGRNDSGQLGDGTMTNRARPGLTAAELDANAVRGIEDVTSVVAGGYHTCAVDINRRVSCWGDNSRGQLGLGDTTSRSAATMIPDLEEVRALSTGKVASELEEICAAGGACAIHSGSATTCALYTTTGIATAIKCWGANTFGQVGMGSTTSANITTPTMVVGIQDNMTMVGVGGAHACALNTNGNLAYCWGSNQGGALGDGNSSFIDESNYRADLDRASAQRILPSVASSGDFRATSVSMGDNHGCVVLRGAALPGGGFEGGEVRCWGSNEKGQLGVGVAASFRSQAPLRTALVADDDTPFLAKSVAVGREHSCAVRTTGELVCWGDNTYGQLGFDTGGESVDTPTVVDVPALATVKMVATGDYHTCAISGTNQLYCWGRNNLRQLGVNSSADAMYVTPLYLSSIGTNAIGIFAGPEHSCVLGLNSYVYCWGRGDQGQIGNGSTVTQPAPAGPAGGGGWGSGGASALALGSSHTCAVRSTQTWCWGDSADGQTAHAVDRLSPFQIFTSTPFYGRSVAAIGAGTRHTCASIDIDATADGVNETICFGLNNHAQLGNGEVSASETIATDGTYGNIVVIDHETGEPLRNVVAIDGSELGTIAILADGTLRMWGENSAGELGFGHTVETFTALAPWRDWQ